MRVVLGSTVHGFIPILFIKVPVLCNDYNTTPNVTELFSS